MKVYAQKQSQPQQKASLHPTPLAQHKVLNQEVPMLSYADEDRKVVTSTPAFTRFAHDFSRIPVHSKAPVRVYAKLKSNTPGVQENDSGETVAPPIIREVQRSSGQPFDTSTRGFMESRFGHDFGQVRVHTGARASDAASAIGARAFTMGRDIVFSSGEYAPQTRHGRWLIAHELAHTIQQAGSATDGIIARQPLSIGVSGDNFEREADRAADAVIRDERGVVEVSASTSALPTVRLVPASGGDNETKPPPSTSGPMLEVDFNAFIPGSLGSSFERYPHPKDLKNQAAFEAALKAVPGTWLPEPGSFSDTNSGAWYFATDNRSFGGGSRRLGFTGNLAHSQIGSLNSKPKVFDHTTSGSEHVRWKHTGYFTSKDETGSVDGPYSKSARPSSSEEHVDNAADESTVTTEAAANYPFKAVSLDIDYTVIFKLKREPGGKTRLRFEITKNLFPFYELLINKKSVWTYSATDPGPTITNLSKSDTFKSGDWIF